MKKACWSLICLVVLILFGSLSVAFARQEYEQTVVFQAKWGLLYGNAVRISIIRAGNCV